MSRRNSATPDPQHQPGNNKALEHAAWWRRHLQATVTIAAVVLILAAVGIIYGATRSSCGSGLTEEGDPTVCVGLNLDSTALRADDDPLAGLEQRVADANKAITEPNFVTVVLLDDLTPDLANDSLALQNVQHEIQGSLTAAWRANNQSVADGRTPPVKLLLANFGSGGRYASQAVDAIKGARDSQHIVAVTGLGQSLDTTRRAASDLSTAHIATIAASTSGDTMNRDPDTNSYIQRFFRITPTNTDAAADAVAYLDGHQYRKVMLVEDTNEHDLYATTLGQAFSTTYHARHETDPYTKTYESPDVPLNDINRATYMTKRFSDMRDSICLQHPDAIYFAGRGSDLGSFLDVLAQGGACGLSTVDVMSGDDTNVLVGKPLPDFRALHVNVLYTGIATTGQWNANAPGQADNAHNYDAFLAAFTSQHAGSSAFGVPADLADGYVMTNHDAVLTAATAARRDPDPVNNPMTVGDVISEFDCQNPVPGASGQIAFTHNSHGNPIDKAMPITQIMPDGSLHVRDLTWTAGQPFGTTSCN